jgi:hypothetical protein
MDNQRVAAIVGAGLLAAGLAQPIAAQTLTGFYGGIALRDNGVDTSGVRVGQAAAALGPVAPVADESQARQRVFGGYRWRNDLALEAAFARSESYALRPFGVGAPGGVGLTLGPRDETPRGLWNVDVVGSYTILRTFALYGRVGFAQSELTAPAPSHLVAGDVRRARDGVNYGLGLRYDLSRVLGVNLDYTRFGRFAFESVGTTLPDSDQVRLGVQFRF